MKDVRMTQLSYCKYSFCNSNENASKKPITSRFHVLCSKTSCTFNIMCTGRHYSRYLFRYDAPHACRYKFHPNRIIGSLGKKFSKLAIVAYRTFEQRFGFNNQCFNANQWTTGILILINSIIFLHIHTKKNQ